MMSHSDHNTITSALYSVARGIKKESYDAAKSTVNLLTAQKNAYTISNIDAIEPGPGNGRWNMITYKEGKKSSL